MIELNNGQVRLHHGDSRDVLKTLADASIDSIVTDPPYALVSIQKRFGKAGSAPAKHGTDGAFARAARGFMNATWDVADTAFAETFWAECLRVLKPGGHVVAFGGTRTYHRLVCAIEDAGFEIRDQIGWAYGSGFPKSHDVSKGIDKRGGDPLSWRAFSAAYAVAVSKSTLTHSDIDRALGIKSSSCYWARSDGRGGMPPRHHWDAVRDLLALPAEMERLYDEAERLDREVRLGSASGSLSSAKVEVVNAGTPATDLAAQWQGWGTALKPAWEPICLARKPLIGTVAENVLEHGTGAINVDGCRVEADNDEDRSRPPRTANAILGGGKGTNLTASEHNSLGRWPANIIHDGSDDVLAAFPSEGDQSEARFFYCAKASRKDRDEGLAHLPKQAGGMVSETSGQHITRREADYKPEPRANIHPTVKPTSLMAYLCRLITPPGGTILDPFLGSGSTGKAAVLEGFNFVGIEREDEYMPIAEARIAWAVLRMQGGVVDVEPEVVPVVAPVVANDNAPQADLFAAPAQAGAA